MKVLYCLAFLLLTFSLVSTVHVPLRGNYRTRKHAKYSKKKRGGFKDHIVRRFLLKSKNILGDYNLDADYFISREVDYKLKWLIFYNLNQIDGSYSERKQLKKTFTQAILRNNLYRLRNGKKLENVIENFKKCYDKENLKLQLQSNHKAFLLRICKPPKNTFSGAVDKVFSYFDDSLPEKLEAKWNLSFNVLSGYKELTIKKEDMIQGVPFYIYYVIPQFSKMFGRTNIFVGDIYLKFDGIFETKYRFGDFKLEVTIPQNPLN